MISPLSRLSLLAALGLALPPLGAQTFTAKDRQPTPEELTHLPAVTASKVEGLMKDVSAPSEFQVTMTGTGAVGAQTRTSFASASVIGPSGAVRPTTRRT